MHLNNKKTLKLAAFLALGGLAPAAQALVIDVVIDGSDAIWLAGRTDVTIPAANLAWPGGLGRHGGPTPEEILETMPSGYGVAAGDVIQVMDPASGGISFFNGFGNFFGPQGNGVPGISDLGSFGGISGYKGTQGALVGVFLTDSIPNGAAPAAIDFGSVGVDFLSLNPGIGQVFFIGDGVTSGSAFQSFIAPTGATRLFLGIPDGFGFSGAPGAYDDNDGAYRIRLGINEDPRNPPTEVPEPGTMLLLSAGLALMGLRARRRRAAATD